MSETRYFMAFNGACIAKCSTVEEAIQIRNRLSDTGIKPESKKPAISGKFVSTGIQIRTNGRFIVTVRRDYVGSYDTVEEAQAARKLFLDTGVKTPTVRKRG